MAPPSYKPPRCTSHSWHHRSRRVNLAKLLGHVGFALEWLLVLHLSNSVQGNLHNYVPRLHGYWNAAKPGMTICVDPRQLGECLSTYWMATHKGQARSASLAHTLCTLCLWASAMLCSLADRPKTQNPVLQRIMYSFAQEENDQHAFLHRLGACNDSCCRPSRLYSFTHAASFTVLRAHRQTG